MAVIVASISHSFANPGRLDVSFVPNPPPDGPVRVILPLADGSILIGGEFTHAGTTAQAYLAKYLEDGSFDPSFDPVINGSVYAIEASSSGGVYIGGAFTNVDGVSSGRLAKLTLAGTLDENLLVVGTGFDGPVYALKENLVGGAPLVVGGNFTTYKGSAAKNLGGLNFQGTLALNYAVNGPVKVISKYNSSGTFVFGGAFTMTGSYSAGNIGLASAYGALSNSSIPRPNGEVSEIRYLSSTPTYQSPAQALVIGGSFTTVSGTAPGIAAFRSLSGSLSKVTFTASGAKQATALATDSDNHLLAASSTGDVWRFDPIIPEVPGTWSWPANPDFLPSSHANGKIDAIVQESKWRYYIGGEFTVVDSQPIPYFARLYGPQGAGLPVATTIQDVKITDDRAWVELTKSSYATGYDVETSGDGGTTWYPAPGTANSFLTVMGLRSSQNYLLRARARNTNGAGPFGPAIEIKTTAARLSGSAVYTPCPGDWTQISSNIKDLMIDAAGRLAIVGPSGIGGRLLGGFAVLDAQQRVVFAYNSTNDPWVNYAAPDPRGGFVVKPNSYPIQRIDANGLPDPGFTAGYDVSYHLRGLAVQSDGKVIMAGNMLESDGAPNNALVRLNADGSVDTTYNPAFTYFSWAGSVQRVKVLPGNRLLVIGEFDTVDGVASNDVVILTEAGEVDPVFRPDPASTQFMIINDAAVDSMGRVILAGFLDNKGNEGRTGVTRFLANGAVDPTWQSHVMKLGLSNASVNLIAVQADDKVLAAGIFDTVNGTQACSVVRLNGDGSVDATFNAGLGLRYTGGTLGTISAMEVLPDTTIAVGGEFGIGLVDGQPREGLALLRGDESPSDYELWLAGNALANGSSPSLDQDLDGIGLGLEFAYRLDPRISDSAVMLTPGDRGARISPPLQRGVALDAYFSETLGPWQAVPIEADWTVRAPAGMGGTKGFFRLGSSR